MSRLVRNYSYVALYQVLVLVVPLVTAPYLARTLGAASLGTVSYVFAVATMMGSFTLLGIFNYGVREAARSSGDRRRLTALFWELMLSRMVLGIVGSLVYLIVSVRSDQWLIFALFYAYFLANVLDVTWLFVGVEEIRPVVFKNIAAKSLAVLAIFLFVKNQEDAPIYVAILAVSTLLTNVSMYPQLRNRIGRSAGVHWTQLWVHVHGSLRLFMPQIAVVLYLQIGRVLLQHYTGDSRQVAFYDQAEKIVMIPLLLVTSLSSVMMPRMASEFESGNRRGMERHLELSGTISLLLAVPMFIGLSLIASDFVPWYLGPEFGPTILAVIVLSPIVVSNSLGGVAGSQFLTATNQVHIMTVAHGFAAIINVLCNVVLIPRLGAVGCAVSAVVASSAAAAIQVFAVRGQMSIRGLTLSGLRYLAFTVPVALTVLSLQFAFPLSWWNTALQVVIGGVVYFGCLLVARDTICMSLLSKGVAVWRGGAGR